MVSQLLEILLNLLFLAVELGELGVVLLNLLLNILLVLSGRRHLVVVSGVGAIRAIKQVGLSAVIQSLARLSSSGNLRLRCQPSVGNREKPSQSHLFYGIALIASLESIQLRLANVQECCVQKVLHAGQAAGHGDVHHLGLVEELGELGILLALHLVNWLMLALLSTSGPARTSLLGRLVRDILRIILK